MLEHPDEAFAFYRKEGELADRTKQRADAIDRYILAYRQYCWTVNSLEDLKLAPFHLLATEGAVHSDKPHTGHKETLMKFCATGEELLMATPFLLVDLQSEQSCVAATAWWTEMTAQGREGMVVKPLNFVAEGRRGTTQPAIKCRGAEYLRIIYGPEYLLPENLERLRSRNVGGKRSLASREVPGRVRWPGAQDADGSLPQHGVETILVFQTAPQSRLLIVSCSSSVIIPAHLVERNQPYRYACPLEQLRMSFFAFVFTGCSTPRWGGERSTSWAPGRRTHRGRGLSPQYINHVVIPLLCRKAGAPLEDACGRISSHRARATIASQLYNAKEPLSLFELQDWLGHSSPESTRHYTKITPTKLAKSYQDAGYFARNVRAVEVLIDQDAVRRGSPPDAPWKLYDLGHGYCSYDFFDQCPNRMACARCDFYVPKQSSKAQSIEAKANLLRLTQEIPLNDDEVCVEQQGRKNSHNGVSAA